MLSGRGADRGQPHDAGRVAGPLARGIQGRHDSSGDAGRLPQLYRKLHQAAARRQAGFAHHDAGRAADVPAAEIRRARARGRRGQQAPLRLDRAAHPHDAARRDEGCGAGAHHSEKSDRERNCAEIQLQADAGAEASRSWTRSCKRFRRTMSGGISSTRSL